MKKTVLALFLILVLFNIVGCTNNEIQQKVMDKESKSQLSGKQANNKKDTLTNIENDSKSNISTIEKTADKKIIVIDPGHADRSSKEKEPISPDSSEMKIKESGGAKGIVTGTSEYILNMNIALNLKNRLEEKGYKVIMTKTEHDKILGNIKRAEIGNEAKADLVIRIHADSNKDRKLNGASMLVPGPVGYAMDIYKESRIYGEIVLEELVKTVGMKNRGVIERKDITGFNWSKVPVILVEVGFLSNEKEDKLLSTESYQDKLAEGLYNGIVKAIK